VNGSVYFDVKKYAESYPYGKLSGRVIDDLLETTRDLEGQDEKSNKTDFALWKSAPPQHIMRWKSPWGEGFPGWHIECSAMSSKYLGETFDIHGGGMDLLFPHHESEIAQSTIVHGHAPVRYWMHNNMITINGKKMGKSYNNVIKLSELFTGTHPILAQAYHPMVVRFYILQTHYRSTLDFSNEALQASEKAFRRLWEAYELLQKLTPPANETAGDAKLDAQVVTWFNECDEFMSDDFNTAKVLANLFELAPVINGIKGGQVAANALSAGTFALLKSTFKTYLEDILGMQPLQAQQGNDKMDQVLSLLIEMRTAAKKRKDFAASDEIRNKLAEAGILLKDEKDGSVSYTIE
jgi:cysteinyl-tRNA synthetase